MINTFLKKLDSQGLPDNLNLIEERALIHEVIQYANQALSSSSAADTQIAVELLEMVEEMNDLCKKMSFNNHLLFNKIEQIVYQKFNLQKYGVAELFNNTASQDKLLFHNSANQSYRQQMPEGGSFFNGSYFTNQSEGNKSSLSSYGSQLDSHRHNSRRLK